MRSSVGLLVVVLPSLLSAQTRKSHFNRGTGVWHTNYLGESQDALRIDVTPETGAHMETLTYYFPILDADSAVLRLHWGTTVVPLRVRAKPD